jgi:hypothetical protein
MTRPLLVAAGLDELAVGVEVLEPPQLTIRKQQQRNKLRNCPINFHFFKDRRDHFITGIGIFEISD